MDYQPPLNGDTGDPDRGYVNANPALGIGGSIPPAAAFEHPQREILEVIEHAGLDPDGADLTQLRQAIQQMIADAVGGVPLDIAWVAGWGADGAGEDLAVQTYGAVILARAVLVTGERLHAEVAPTGADLEVDVLVNGASIYAIRPVIAAGAYVGTPGTLTTPAGVVLSAGDRLTWRVTQVGSIIAGQRLRMTLAAEAV
ncbi:hypothetical protein [Roseospirillum parvum]|uniref:Uncharacterized protein n=1 Tax=Roseospirillum parvum TaxID=83401 RepID=A0A1G8G1S0_9PROT|nr:hypothetical protein [Roseospirillum parvum]SDH88176.1 hypothetical protein SAMN05421742_11811 [Roseospirillum parvum]